jgi:hypothetical protein
VNASTSPMPFCFVSRTATAPAALAASTGQRLAPGRAR